MMSLAHCLTLSLLSACQLLSYVVCSIRRNAGSVLPTGSVLGEYVGEVRSGSNREHLIGDFPTKHSRQVRLTIGVIT